MPEEPSPSRRVLAMLSLVLAGEAVFIPAFHLGRYFKSSMLDVFGIDELQLGQLYAWYGAVAMVSYLLGGPLADRFSPRKLIAGSLLITAAGGLYMATLPSFTALRLLFAFWGASTILTFWAPLIRATREWGGHLAQGAAFGLLDGGRGLLSAVIATIAAIGFDLWIGDAKTPDPAREAIAIRGLLAFYSAWAVASAACVWLFVPDSPSTDDAPQPACRKQRRRDAWRRVLGVMRMPAIWLQTLVVITAYCAFKTIDYYGYYCEDAYGIDAAESAHLIAWLSYLRAGAALAAGWLADRWLGASGAIISCFLALLASYVGLLVMPTTDAFYWLAVANIAVSFAAFFGLRGIYFALFEEAGVPPHATGTAVGVVSFIGFTPDIFMPLLTGWLVKSARDAGNVMAGYQQLFTLLAVLAVVGAIAAWLLRQQIRRNETEETTT